eukprot:XP_027303749.1 small nuclear ribonucleoprotein E-like [Anas platyrhynchos]
MGYRGQGQKVQKVMVQPINLIFRYLQNRSRIHVWLYEQVNMRIEGCIMVSIRTSPRYIFRFPSFTILFFGQEKLSQGKKEIVLL